MRGTSALRGVERREITQLCTKVEEVLEHRTPMLERNTLSVWLRKMKTRSAKMQDNDIDLLFFLESFVRKAPR